MQDLDEGGKAGGLAHHVARLRRLRECEENVRRVLGRRELGDHGEQGFGEGFPVVPFLGDLGLLHHLPLHLATPSLHLGRPVSRVPGRILSLEAQMIGRMLRAARLLYREGRSR